MAATSNKKILIGGIGAVALLVVVVLVAMSLTSDSGAQSTEPRQPVAQGEDSSLESDAADMARRSGSGTAKSRSGRLTGGDDQVGAAADDSADQVGVEKKTRKPTKKRGRKRRTREAEEEEESKGTGKQKREFGPS